MITFSKKRPPIGTPRGADELRDGPGALKVQCFIDLGIIWDPFFRFFGAGAVELRTEMLSKT
jgi:hypothetical protein